MCTCFSNKLLAQVLLCRAVMLGAARHNALASRAWRTLQLSKAALAAAAAAVVRCRAGRDGQPAECVLMFSGADVNRLQYMTRMCES
jgi:hypothetical protein